MCYTRQMTTIYESPDQGKTVYARKMGEQNRTLIKGGPGQVNITSVGPVSLDIQVISGGGGSGSIHNLGQKYRDILVTAETNPALKKAVEQMELIYGLTKKY